MSKNIIGVGVAALAVIAIVGVVVSNKPDTTSSSSSNQSSTSSEMGSMDMKEFKPKASAVKEDLTSQKEVNMDIVDFAFEKKDITIKKGTKVTWTNRDDAKHNAFGEQEGGPMGELLAQGESYSYMFDTAGTFNYKCEPHPYMKGMVTVVE